MRIDPDKLNAESRDAKAKKAEAIKEKVARWFCFAAVFVFFFKLLFF